MIKSVSITSHLDPTLSRLDQDSDLYQRGVVTQTVQVR